MDADGHANEGEVDISARLPEAWRSQGPVSLKDNQGYPRILLEGRILTCASEESGLDRVLEAAGASAVEFFGLGNLPEPNAVRAARSSWTREAAAEGALR